MADKQHKDAMVWQLLKTLPDNRTKWPARMKTFDTDILLIVVERSEKIIAKEGDTATKYLSDIVRCGKEEIERRTQEVRDIKLNSVLGVPEKKSLIKRIFKIK